MKHSYMYIVICIKYSEVHFRTLYAASQMFFFQISRSKVSVVLDFLVLTICIHVHSLITKSYIQLYYINDTAFTDYNKI